MFGPKIDNNYYFVTILILLIEIIPFSFLVIPNID